MRFIELCVELRKSDLAKDGLFQYRTTSLQVPNSLEAVIKHFLNRAREAAKYETILMLFLCFWPSSTL